MRKRRDAGFSLAALIFFAAAASILAAAAVPAYKLQAQRELEEELIFRGEEYTRAILKFQRKFGIYPPTIDALLETNSVRFLRKPYVDPITGKPFRILTINPDGSISGSVVLSQGTGNTQLFRGLSMFEQPNNQNAGTAGRNTNPAPGAPNTPNTPNTPNSGTTNTNNFSFGPTTGTQPSGNNTSANPGRNNASPQTGPNNVGRALAPAGNNPTGFTGGVGGIIGVGATSEATALKVYNNRQKYNEWEFVAILQQQNPNAPGGAIPPGGTPPPGGSAPPPGTGGRTPPPPVLK